jgi:hypothetical protein
MERLDDALRFFANKVFSSGTSKERAIFCIKPSWYRNDKDSDEAKASDIIVEKLDATHYDLIWEEVGKIIKIIFYRGDAYGACSDKSLKELETYQVTI